MIDDLPQTSGFVDPRVRRSRQMLHEALERLLASRSMEKISVSDIAEEASLNRATFYDHYPDKFALLEGLVASRFQELIDQRGVVFHGSCPEALRRIALATCDYLAGLPGGDCASRRQLEKNLESAIMSVVRRTILSGIRAHSPNNGLAPELVAATLSGAIYGGAREWVQTPNRVPADEIVNGLMMLIGPVLAAA